MFALNSFVRPYTCFMYFSTCIRYSGIVKLYKVSKKESDERCLGERETNFLEEIKEDFMEEGVRLADAC